MLLNLNPENFMDKNGKLKYPRFIELSDEIKEVIEKLMNMKDENDDLSLEQIKMLKFYQDINFEDVLNRKGESGIKPMNLDIQKQNNLGVVTDEIIDEKEEIEKEKYTLFNYDSDSDNNDENDT